MADDFDIDGMLEATFKKAKEEKVEKAVVEEKEKKSKSHKRSSRDRSKSSRHRSEKKHRSRSRRSRSGSKKRSRSRRSRSRDRKHRRRSRSRSRNRKSRSKDRSRRSRSRERVARDQREKTPDGPAPSEDDRDERTVFCMQLSQRIRSRDLEEFFSAVGKVREVKLIADKHSKRSKGIAYVEFKNLESVPLALGLNGQKLLGVPIIVQPTQSEKNKVAAANNLLSKGPTKLYVGNLHENISEEMLKAVFQPFGRVDLVQIIRDNETNASKGYAFITFAEAQQAKQALDQLNGFDIAGRPIRLNTVSSNAEVSTSALGGPSFLDNESIERNGIDLGTTGRLQLMAKLAEGTGLKVPSSAQHALMVGQQMGLGLQGSQPIPGTTQNQPPVATNCFQLQNMFDPSKESGDGWDAEIRDDVIEECSRHGDVHHVHVDKNAKNGVVYVKCANLDVAQKSVASLHGRYFSGNMITANYVPLQAYNQMFPQATFATIPLKK